MRRSNGPVAFLNALQLADSTLPVGRFVHSSGLESWLSRNRQAGEQQITELVETLLIDMVAPLDGAVVAHAHRARDVPALTTLDRHTSAHKLAAPAREASQSCGRQYAALAAGLTDDPLVTGFAGRIRRRETDGNLVVIEGTLARSLGLSAAEAVLVELRGAAAGVLSAAVRLGRLSPFQTQLILHDLAPVLAGAAAEALALPLEDLRSTGPELEIAALTHRRADARMFST